MKVGDLVKHESGGIIGIVVDCDDEAAIPTKSTGQDGGPTGWYYDAKISNCYKVHGQGGQPCSPAFEKK